jgi:hypothetical protein
MPKIKTKKKKQNESIMFIADGSKLQGFPQIFDDSQYK